MLDSGYECGGGCCGGGSGDGCCVSGNGSCGGIIHGGCGGCGRGGIDGRNCRSDSPTKNTSVWLVAFMYHNL